MPRMALSRGVRRLMLVIAVVLFGAVSYVLILYAQGLTFSFDEWDFVATGALIIDANEQVDVFIDGEHAGSTSVIAHYFSKGRMLPGTYHVSLQREGYSTWSKSVMIQERFVTDFSHVLILDLSEERASRSRAEIERALMRAQPMLTPAPSPVPSPTPTPAVQELTYALEGGRLTLDDHVLATGVRGYQESADGMKLMWWTRNEVTVMWLRDTAYQPFRLAGESETITRVSAGIERAAWWPDSHHVAFRSGTDYRVVELDNRGGTNVIEL